MSSSIQQSPSWVKDAIFYQIFPDRFYRGRADQENKSFEPWGNLPRVDSFFGGNLDGILKKLDHLQMLKINALYLTPIFKAETNHKYDTSDYYLIDPAFGSNEEFKMFVDSLHQQSLKVILDGVFNHSGEKFPPFVDLWNKGEKSSYKEWYRILRFPLTIYPTTYETCGGCTYLPKFNLDNEQVRALLLDVARYWIKNYSIDGWRLDSAVKVPTNFWKDFYTIVKGLSPDAYVTGEVWWEPTTWLAKGMMDGTTNYLLRSLMLTFFARHEMDAEDFRVEIDSLIARLGESAGYMLNFLSSHDTPRAFTQFNGEIKYLRLAIIFLFCMMGVPMIYYGDEIGLPGGSDPDCRRCMPWDPKDWNTAILECYKKVSSLRTSQIALRRGKYESLLANDHLFAFRRFFEDQSIIVLLNVGNEMVNINIDTNSSHMYWLNYFTGEVIKTENSKIKFPRISSADAIILIAQ